MSLVAHVGMCIRVCEQRLQPLDWVEEGHREHLHKLERGTSTHLSDHLQEAAWVICRPKLWRHARRAWQGLQVCCCWLKYVLWCVRGQAWELCVHHGEWSALHDEHLQTWK